MVMENYYPIAFDNVYYDECKITMDAKDKFEVNVININTDTGNTKQAFMFVIMYMNTYGDKVEIRAPEQPLPLDRNICELFGREIDIFRDIISDIDNLSDRSAILAKMKHIVEIIRIAEIFKLELLIDKLAAILAYCAQKPLA